jgi:hypothetical protein
MDADTAFLYGPRPQCISLCIEYIVEILSASISKVAPLDELVESSPIPFDLKHQINKLSRHAQSMQVLGEEASESLSREAIACFYRVVYERDGPPHE